MASQQDGSTAFSDYPRPSVAVDTAVLTVADRQLCVGVLRDDRSDQLRLPGTFLHEDETLADSVRRSLREKAGIDGVEPEQLHVFDDPRRDNRGWVLSVAHVAVVRPGALGALTPLPVVDAHGLDFDHDEIVRQAAKWMRADYAEHPDPAALLTEPFTIAALRGVHEAVAGERLQPDTFRRRMLPSLHDVDQRRRGGVGKPAALYARGAPT